MNQIGFYLKNQSYNIAIYSMVKLAKKYDTNKFKYNIQSLKQKN